MKWIASIQKYKPYNKQEEKDKAIILTYINHFRNILTRENGLAHITSSAFVLNKDRDKLLMVYHNIYNSWSWIGGHADGEKNLLYVALKEAYEETGIRKVYPVDDQILSLDVLPVHGHFKKGKYIAPHLHLSVTYLFTADENEELTTKIDENSDVRWIPLEEIAEYSTEPHMIEVYNKILEKL